MIHNILYTYNFLRMVQLGVRRTFIQQCLYTKLLHKRKLSDITSKLAMEIKTFVFLDSETTGLPSQEHNKTRMTELCFTAVQSDHLRLGIFPRIQSKLTLCFNPRKLIHPLATDVSGLSNHLLELQPEFNEDAFKMIQTFLSFHQQPICFVAHNGDMFDYPILKAELHRTGHELPGDILCVDSLKAFREMYAMDMKQFYEGEAVPTREEQKAIQVPPEFQDGYDELLCSIADNLESSNMSTGKTQCSGEFKKMSVEEVQKTNETTPKKIIQFNSSNGSKGAKRQLPFGRPSFKLVDVYTRLTAKEPVNAHRAEVDVGMLIECAAVQGGRFVDWSNSNAKKFCGIPMMTPGKYIGT